MSGDITIMAVGGAGCKILSQLAAMPQTAGMQLLAVDTDQRALDATGLPPERTLLAGRLWRNGRGCNGNEIDGQRAMVNARPELVKHLEECKMLVVLGGLGRGTATGAMMVLPGVVSKLKLPTLFLLTLPFAMEGHTLRRRAEKVLNEDVYPVADAVIALPNDLLFATLDSSTPLERAFALADEEVGRTALALSQALTAGNLLNADYGDITAFLKRRKTSCCIGVGLAQAASEPETAVAKLLASPLLGGSSRLAEADAVVLSLLGGPELSLGNAKSVLDLVSRYLGESSQLLVAASTAPEWSGQLQLTALAVKFDDRTEAAAPERRRGTRKPVRSEDDQPTLPFMENDKGAMTGTLPVFWNSEDLDVPTYQRRNVVIDNGRRR